MSNDRHWDLFISYSHRDKAFVQKLSADLIAQGIKIWLDEKNIGVGDSLTQKIRDGIDQSDFVAVVISFGSLDSEWVRREIDIATNIEISSRTTRVLPIKIDDSPLPWFLEGKYYADFSSSYVQALTKVISTIRPSLNKIVRVADSIVSVDLYDPKGKAAKVSRHRRITCLKGVITEWNDCFTVAGTVTPTDIAPGIKVSSELCGSMNFFQYFIPALHEYNSMDLYQSFDIHDSFLEKDEYWTLFGKMSCHECRKGIVKDPSSILEIVFPAERPYTSFLEKVRVGHNVVPNPIQIQELNRGDRKVIRGEIQNNMFPVPPEYTISWTW